MDETLKRLLEVELQAEQITRDADRARERMVQEALVEARAEEARFEARIPELHAAFLEKAELRAQQTISELQRRYDEHHTTIRELAAEHEIEALEAALQFLLDEPGSSGNGVSK